MSNDTQVAAHTALAKECGAITYTHRSNPHEAAVSFGPMAWEKFVEASARKLAAPERCPYCDDTGDVHSIDGEWRGTCNCPAGRPLTASPTAQPSEPVGEREDDDPWLSGDDMMGASS